jgi:23S rRNA (uracil1939-C5)-methyltransferase
VGDELEVDLGRPVAGGRSLATGPDGRVVLVAGALPGERALVRVTDEQRRHLLADAVEIVRPVAARRVAPCAAVAMGCGGCDLQDAGPDAQQEWKVEVVADSLRRLGDVDGPDVEVADGIATWGHRTTVRALVDEDRAALRRRASHEPIVVDECPVAHPLVEQVLVEGRFPGADEVVVRVGAATGERMVVVSPIVGRAQVPDAVRLVGDDELDAGKRAWIHEEVAGVRLRVSARSFFQTHAEGAGALVRTVAELLPEATSADRLVDAYAGVGLLAACLPGGPSRRVVAVERSASAAADARINLPDARVVRSDVDRWHATSADVVVADPARAGLGKAAAKRLSETGASAMALVSCDPASLGRDVGLLRRHGWMLDRVKLVDLFPQTWHVEAVSRFVRS